MSPDFGVNPDADTSGLIEYVNVPPVLGALVSSKLVTLADLQTAYGTEDAYNLLEVVTVDAHNQRVIAKRK